MYIGDAALQTLEWIRGFFRSWGYEASDSSIMTSALATYSWYLQAKQGPVKCPNPACGESLSQS